MNLQVLVSTMHQSDLQILEKMNIQSEAIIINQCNKYMIEELKYRGNNIRLLSFPEKGVGLSRNNALMRATADICVFGDDDVTYVDGYKELILKAFEETPKADVIVFNVPSTNPERPTYEIPKFSRVRWYNCQRYGAVKIAVRLEKVKLANVYFSLLFGGGAKYSNGEDSLFIIECLKKGLKIYANPSVIGHVSQESSSWFNGYTDKFFIDKGVFFFSVSKIWGRILCLQFAVRHRKLFKKDKTPIEAYKLMMQGIKQLKRQNINKSW
jgi:glycosyltransferase involved in cell wall biosynthesis